MARFLRLDVLNEIVRIGLIPLFYHHDIEVAKKVIAACVEGGVKVFEFTNRGDNAYYMFSELTKYIEKEFPSLILGVGSVLDPGTAAIYISSGANFVVGSVLNADVAKICNRRKIPYMPGCGTASEISYAEELGSEVVKIFPGESVGGSGFVKSLLGPTPWSRLLITGGVKATEESVKEWFNAGATAVGLGSDLVKKEWVQVNNYKAISELTTQVIQWINEAKGTNVFYGIEHIGLYPTKEHEAKDITEWYNKTFDFKITEGSSSIFMSSTGTGRIEISKTETNGYAHIAVLVTNFEKAMEMLKLKGVELEKPNLKPETKSVYLKSTDPLGNRIHLLWRR